MAVIRWDRRASEWARDFDLVHAFRDRPGRKARALASLLDGYDDDEVVLRPWEIGLPRVAVLAAARARGFEPAEGGDALVERGMWLEPMRFTRAGRTSEGAAG